MAYSPGSLCLVLVIAYLVQVTSAVYPASFNWHATPSTPSTCHHPNYLHGCSKDRESRCEFTVSWWSGGSEGVRGGGGEGGGGLVNINFTAQIPSGQEGTQASLTMSQGGSKGVFTCDHNSDTLSHFNCSNTLKHGGEQEHCVFGEVAVQNSQLQCSFIVPNTSTWRRLLSTNVLLSVTSGPVGSEEYTHQATSKCKCNISSCSDTCSCEEKSGCHSAFSLLLIRSHGITMVVTFLLLLPTAVIIARYYRLAFPASWFRAHVVTMVTGVVFMIIGLVVVLGHTGGKLIVGLHQVVGIVCVALALLQPVCGFLRPSVGPTLQRRVFNIVHRSVGLTALGLGTLNLVLGVILYHNSVFVVMLCVLVTALVVEGGFVVAMEIIMRRNNAHPPPVGYQRVQTGKVEEEEGERKEGEGEEEGGMESESDREVYVREDMKGGQGKLRGLRRSVQLPNQHWIVKRVLLFFIVQSFVFSALVAILISYGQH